MVVVVLVERERERRGREDGGDRQEFDRQTKRENQDKTDTQAIKLDQEQRTATHPPLEGWDQCQCLILAQSE